MRKTVNPSDILYSDAHQWVRVTGKQATVGLTEFKALSLGARQGHSRDALLASETRLFADTWVHDDHWTAADAILGARS